MRDKDAQATGGATSPRLREAARGVKTTQGVARMLSALLEAVCDGGVDNATADALANVSGKVLAAAKIQARHGALQPDGTRDLAIFRDGTEEVAAADLSEIHALKAKLAEAEARRHNGAR